VCFLTNRQKTVEEIVAEKSAGMTDAQKAEYWWELTQSIFALLGKVDVPVFELSPSLWITTAQTRYPSLTDVKFADSRFFTTSLQGLQEILRRDWTNLVPYIAETGDCDKYATRLYSHLCDYYSLNAIVPVWGDTDAGYHGFNLAVLKHDEGWTAKLIEPQSDAVFDFVGPLGRYTPRVTAIELGIRRK
jgi:hypothetical protein